MPRNRKVRLKADVLATSPDRMGQSRLSRGLEGYSDLTIILTLGLHQAVELHFPNRAARNLKGYDTYFVPKGSLQAVEEDEDQPVG